MKGQPVQSLCANTYQANCLDLKEFSKWKHCVMHLVVQRVAAGVAAKRLHRNEIE
jgi:hypothetical protein